MSAFSFSTNYSIQQLQKTPAFSKHILRIEGNGNYSMICFTDGRKVLSARHLGYYEEILDMTCFLRVHKSTLVNVNFIKTIGKDDIQLTNGHIVAVARRRRKDLKDRINSHEK
jgi:two-component system LytT family response regulator